MGRIDGAVLRVVRFYEHHQRIEIILLALVERSFIPNGQSVHDLNGRVIIRFASQGAERQGLDEFQIAVATGAQRQTAKLSRLEIGLIGCGRPRPL